MLARLLHPLRRRRALDALGHRRMPAEILVVCHGNICRSPFGAALLARDLAAAGVRITSAGFAGPSRPCPPEAVAAAERRGARLATHRSRLIMADVARSADLVVVMDPAQGRAVRERFGRLERDILVLGDLDPRPITGRTIRDPLNRNRDVYEESYARIERCVAELVRVLTSPESRASRMPVDRDAAAHPR
jgi:protein-tyrosine phosphatase